ncbi:hypothetical protein SDC9_201949 [bioreactor metagenome]|uniref:Uncharacterized protein n=1 Tax=bioreactor metagenome TaxID=1076179 RepID=A0A645IV35_9ZZZZ
MGIHILVTEGSVVGGTDDDVASLLDLLEEGGLPLGGGAFPGRRRRGRRGGSGAGAAGREPRKQRDGQT